MPVSPAGPSGLQDSSSTFLVLTSLRRKEASSCGTPVSFNPDSQFQRDALKAPDARGVLTVSRGDEGGPNVSLRPGAIGWTAILMLNLSQPLSRTVSGLKLLKPSEVELVLDLLRDHWLIFPTSVFHGRQTRGFRV